MKKLLTSSLAAIILTSPGCAIFGDKKDEIVTVKTETIYRTVPDELIDCPDPIVLTPEQILEIIDAEDDVDTESLYNKYFVAPTVGAHETCWKSANEIRQWNKFYKNENLDD